MTRIVGACHELAIASRSAAQIRDGDRWNAHPPDVPRHCVTPRGTLPAAKQEHFALGSQTSTAASTPAEPVHARKVISATGPAPSIKQRYRRSSTARPCRQIMRQLLDRIAEALIARNIEQIVDDLFQGLLVNMPAQRLRDLAHSGIRCSHDSFPRCPPKQLSRIATEPVHARKVISLTPLRRTQAIGRLRHGFTARRFGCAF